MRTLVMRILWLAAAGALFYGGFVAYERWWDGDLSFMKDRVLSFVNENADEVKKRAAEKGNEVLETVKQEATEQAKITLSSLIGGVIESIGETIATYGESVAGVPTEVPTSAVSGSGFQSPPPPIALSAKVGEVITFAVNEGTSYRATWGDGVLDEGDRESDMTVLIRHAWETTGDYTVTLVTEVNSVSHTETFPVRIYER